MLRHWTELIWSLKRVRFTAWQARTACGKSTIINIISGFYTPDAGTIEIDGREYTKLTTQQAIEAGYRLSIETFRPCPILQSGEILAITMEKSRRRKVCQQKEI